MATAKKSKSARKPRASVKEREIEAQLTAVREKHSREVKDLGERILVLFEESKSHPTVLLDTLQTMLSVGIGSLYGEEHKERWDAYVASFHDESKMLTILEMFETRFVPEPESDTDANDYAKGM